VRTDDDQCCALNVALLFYLQFPFDVIDLRSQFSAANTPSTSLHPYFADGAYENSSRVAHTLREQIKGPTAAICADGYLSGPSAQIGMSSRYTGDRRHREAISTGKTGPRAAMLPSAQVRMARG
jgi:hypothetical protein